MSFLRQARLIVDTFEITTGIGSEDGLDFAFDVVKTLDPEPNVLTLQIFNMGEAARFQLAMLAAQSAASDNFAPIVATLEAGYQDEGMSQIFFGQVRRIHSAQDGVDTVTTLESGDGEKAIAKARINKTISRGTPVKRAIEELIKALESQGLDGGDARQAIASIALSGQTTFANGTTLTGSVFRQMSGLLNSAGLEWSVQDNSIQILTQDVALQGQSIVLGPDSGLLGSPEIDSDGVVTCVALLNPNILPGRSVTIDSKFVQGDFRIESCHYTGATFSDDWRVEIEAKR